MEENRKCAHKLCKCVISDGEEIFGKHNEYCSDHCEEADDQDIVEIECDCGHQVCEWQ